MDITAIAMYYQPMSKSAKAGVHYRETCTRMTVVGPGAAEHPALFVAAYFRGLERRHRHRGTEGSRLHWGGGDQRGRRDGKVREGSSRDDAKSIATSPPRRLQRFAAAHL
eukprot:3619671-Pyramimonas_sp.AAC.1